MAVNQDYTAEGGVWIEAYYGWEWRDDQGQCHRVDGPAFIGADGSQAWWLHGRRHRVDGPAMIYADGSSAWWLHGRRHRVDGPAVIYPNGYQAWYRHNRRYRADGPAVMRVDGSSEWYVQGRDITREVEEWMHDNDITLPFTPEQRMEFQLRWL